MRTITTSKFREKISSETKNLKLMETLKVKTPSKYEDFVVISESTYQVLLAAKQAIDLLREARKIDEEEFSLDF